MKVEKYFCMGLSAFTVLPNRYIFLQEYSQNLIYSLMLPLCFVIIAMAIICPEKFNKKYVPWFILYIS